MTTPFTALNEFPSVAADTDSGFSFLYRAGSEEQPHLLVYESERDFKSVPRTFIVVAIVALDTDAVELNIDADDIPAEPGVYHWPDSDACDGDDQLHFLLVTPQRNFEALAHKATVTARLYHARDTGDALVSYVCRDPAVSA
ncbi:hypothetical protein ACQUQU_02130 [Thalassolituus sp. LLYu03]|uniref:hypothetical protein n=1 Tax=Thalassolituus sp. LLYu03 TaxID=3421656 RepID=UPI003D28A40A